LTESARTTVSRLVAAAAEGDRQALDALFPLVYEEIRALARRQRRRWRGQHTLNTTALVHEAYLKLAGSGRLDVQSRAHFLAIAATAMRQILINYAESRRTQKRGGELRRVSLSDAPMLEPASAEARAARADLLPRDDADLLIELDAALRKLAIFHSRLARVVECRFFGGMTVDETALALAVSPRTVRRDWTVAQAWLHARLEGDA
jgi:RNA polymerase sigma factor (TIGR02999 family)